MARIVSVTFETESHSRAGHFTIPRRIADFLAIKDDDPVELSVLCEGLKVEVQTQLRSGLEVYHREDDKSTAGLERLPANAPLLVTVWHPGDEQAPKQLPREWDAKFFRGCANRPRHEASRCGGCPGRMPELGRSERCLRALGPREYRVSPLPPG